MSKGQRFIRKATITYIKTRFLTLLKSFPHLLLEIIIATLSIVLDWCSRLLEHN